VCDSYVRPHVLVHICDECNYGSFEVISVNHVVEAAWEILPFSAICKFSDRIPKVDSIIILVSIQNLRFTVIAGSVHYLRCSRNI
jgi:hypothetical protein